MSPEVKSVTAAFVVIFIVIAARHQWLTGFTGWLKAAPKASTASAVPPVQAGTGQTGPSSPEAGLPHSG